MVAGPGPTPRTKPLELTVATDVLLLAQAIVRPVSVLPLESFGVAVSCAVCPAGPEAGAGLTATDARGTDTAVPVIAAVPFFPSDVAVRVAEPAASPLTSPLELTVATDVLPLVQAIVRPVSALPFASLGVAG